ncbi:MAG: ankyrin repeat domain-containing protein [Prolixibacteraceae bacterium]|nr:ankyrin repeat domain-containing protein [Prolixibacteraceae bacterium]
MKTLKINSFKMLVAFSFVLVLLTHASAQSVEKPQMDIQAAIVSGNLDIVKQHIAAGTDINKKDQMSGTTPLITAATFGKTDIVKVLLDANANPDLKNNEGSTALHAAAFFCRVEIVQMLLDAGADKTIKNNHGGTPRESVIVPFTEMKPVYETIQKQLEPFGLKLDLEEIEKTRPFVAMLLR